MTLVMKLVREREIIDREKYRTEYDRIFGVKPVSLAAASSLEGWMADPEEPAYEMTCRECDKVFTTTANPAALMAACYCPTCWSALLEDSVDGLAAACDITRIPGAPPEPELPFLAEDMPELTDEQLAAFKPVKDVWHAPADETGVVEQPSDGIRACATANISG